MHAQTMSGVSSVSVAVDPAYWAAHDQLSPNQLALQLSPGSSSIHGSVHSNSQSSPAQTPPSDSSRKNSTIGPANGQKELPRASVAVACVPCRSRHLKCDGGVRCSRCKDDGVECTYIKSRRGWKGKRKGKPDEAGACLAVHGASVWGSSSTPQWPNVSRCTCSASLCRQWPYIVARVFLQQ